MVPQPFIKSECINHIQNYLESQNLSLVIFMILFWSEQNAWVSSAPTTEVSQFRPQKSHINENVDFRIVIFASTTNRSGLHVTQKFPYFHKIQKLHTIIEQILVLLFEESYLLHSCI